MAHIRETIFELSSLGGGAVGLVGALQDLARDFQRTAQIRVEVQARGDAYHLPAAVE